MAGFLWSFRGDLDEDYVALPKISGSGEEIHSARFCMLIDGIQMINHTVCCLCNSLYQRSTEEVLLQKGTVTKMCDCSYFGCVLQTWCWFAINY